MTGSTERVEFLDGTPDAGHGDVLDLGPGGPARRPGGRLPGDRRWWIAAAALVVVVFVVLSAGAQAGRERPRALRTTTPPPIVPTLGVVALPTGISAPRQLITTGAGDDVVWVLDHGSGIVRIQSGAVTATQLLDAPVDAIAVDGDGAHVYASTTGRQLGVQELDGHTLAPGRTVATPVRLQTLTVDAGFVWGIGFGELDGFPTQLAGSTAATPDVSRRPLPGIITADRLEARNPSPGRSAVLTALVTTTDAVGARVLTIDTASGSTLRSTAFRGTVSVAVTPLGTWVSASTGAAAGPGLNLTEQLGASSLRPDGGRASVAVGGRIWPVRTGRAAFLSAATGGAQVVCHDPGGFRNGAVELDIVAPGARTEGPVARTAIAFYTQTSRGLVRTGVGTCP